MRPPSHCYFKHRIKISNISRSIVARSISILNASFIIIILSNKNVKSGRPDNNMPVSILFAPWLALSREVATLIQRRKLTQGISYWLLQCIITGGHSKDRMLPHSPVSQTGHRQCDLPTALNLDKCFCPRRIGLFSNNKAGLVMRISISRIKNSDLCHNFIRLPYSKCTVSIEDWQVPFSTHPYDY